MNTMMKMVSVLVLGVLAASCGEPPTKKMTREVVVISDEDVQPHDTDHAPETAARELTALHIELTWNTPADLDQSDDVGADLDLHFVHPSGTWNDEPYDIFGDNPTADWGEPGPEDDPMLDIHDSDGEGPELLIYDALEDDMYFDVGVHYVDDNGFGTSYPTIRVFRDGELMFQRDTRLEVGGFWRVARVSADNALLLDVVSTDMPEQ